MEVVETLSQVLRDQPILELLLVVAWSAREVERYVSTRNGPEGGRVRERVAQLEARMQTQEEREIPPKLFEKQVDDLQQDLRALSQHVHGLRCQSERRE